jgi:hypothetical protein
MDLDQRSVMFGETSRRQIPANDMDTICCNNFNIQMDIFKLCLHNEKLAVVVGP